MKDVLTITGPDIGELHARPETVGVDNGEALDLKQGKLNERRAESIGVLMRRAALDLASAEPAGSC